MPDPRARRGDLDVRFSPYLFVAPFFVVFAFVGLFPLLYTLWVSLNDWSLVGGQGDFVALDNYQRVLTTPLFWISLRNTVSIFLFSVVPQLILATAIAAALATNLRAKTFWRMGVLLPYVVAPVAVALIFGNLFGDQFGLVNQALQAVGLPPVAWHANAPASHFAIATMVNFRWTGYNALILLAGMMAVPRELYESAAIDGAGPIRSFFSVTLPQIRSTMIFVVITATVGGLQIFDEPRLFDASGSGGANNQWTTATMYIYRLGWTQTDFGRASAVAVLLLLIIVGVGLLNFALSRLISGDQSKRSTPPGAQPGTTPRSGTQSVARTPAATAAAPSRSEVTR